MCGTLPLTYRDCRKTQDKSFTLTLFAHETTFKSLDSQFDLKAADGDYNPIIELFRKEFPDALELMGEEALMKSWKENPKDGLITVEVSRLFAHPARSSASRNTDAARVLPLTVLTLSLQEQSTFNWRFSSRNGSFLR